MLLHTKYTSYGSQDFREEDFYSFSHLWKLLISGRNLFGPQGLHWQDLCSGSLNIATY